ncbi:AraC family transcriptional regulator [Paenibacillus sp. CF384]|uniref:AraC family transcriptional regulator n=1 Tax=Paenibacillus sp. CF384 TaxID=1884382 RepID=UPI00089A3210|nr:AraC family transcriptional regulator [Paenibacillus sp. CF384]SDW95522.1 transcriptional regulator, AraC family [Paenibacillus sp. CF384]
MEEEERYKGIWRAAAYVEQHLQEELRLEELAKLAGYSPFHFHRLFYACTGETLSHYIRERRLAYAARRLRDSEQSGTGIGFDIGYGSHESFIRSFMKRFGEPPQSLRRRVCTMREPVLINRETIHVAGVLCTTDTTKDRNIAQAWKSLSRIWASIPGKVDERVCFGLEIYNPLTSGDREREFDYLAGTEVADPLQTMPGDAVVYTIPGGRYAVFTHVGSTELLGETFRYIYGEWLTASGETLRGMGDRGYDYEYYDARCQEGRADSELDIYVPLRPIVPPSSE